MEPERWQRIERLYYRAGELDQGEREAFLQQECAGDESLRREVESLLAFRPKAGTFIESPAIEMAAQALAKDQARLPSRDLIGRTIAHYRVIEKIGEGGMGEVFLADDTSLHRKVALKFLPPEMQQDSAAHKRFIREAHSAASLDHPFICSIHEVGEFEGQDFIVMEYVDGQTLKDRLAGGSLSLKEALQIATEVSEALEAAHGKGIIHRDIKPANIMITKAGHAKVMDFGLAKQLIPPGGIKSQEESVTALSRSGMAFGTLAYMSPEQLRGEMVDVRSDIFSFGLVLYEMLTGVHPFKKQTGMDTAGAILNLSPQPIGELRPDVPVLLEHIVKKMLAKDPRDRYESIHDVRIDMKALQEESDLPERVRGRRLRLRYWSAAAALVVVGVGTWAFLRFYPRKADSPPPRIVPVTTSGAEGPSLSPDGNWVAYHWKPEKEANSHIYVREVDGTGFSQLTGDLADDCCPAWSPDGRQIAFLRISDDRGELYLTSPLGGGVRKLAGAGQLAPVLGSNTQLAWSPDGKTIAFADKKSPNDPISIWSLSLETMDKRQVTTPEAATLGDGHPAFSPDGRHLAFVRFRWSGFALYVIQLPRGEPRLVTDYKSPWYISWTADSREILFTTFFLTGEEAIMRISVDGSEPRRVPTRGDAASQPTVSRNRLAYISNNVDMDIWKLELTGPEPTKPPPKRLFPRSSSERNPRISPDGRRIAFESDSSGSSEIWVCDADGTKPVKLTDMKATVTEWPSWSPDGKWIAFDSTKSGSADIYVLSAEEGPVRRITTETTDEWGPSWSRDGRWLYFSSNENGIWQIWKIPSEGGKAIQITQQGGKSPRESGDGYLYFFADSSEQKKGIWRVPVSGGPETLVTQRLSSPPHWDLTERGIYFADYNAKPVAVVRFYDFATRHLMSLGPVHGDPAFKPYGSLSVSSDGKWLLCNGGFGTQDVWMIDNFQ